MNKLILYTFVLIAVIALPIASFAAPTNSVDQFESGQFLPGPSSAGDSPFRLTMDELKSGVIEYYGSGVYNFSVTNKRFGFTLADFLKSHPKLEVTAMTGNVVRRSGARIRDLDDSITAYSDYGVAVGYFVTFREKESK